MVQMDACSALLAMVFARLQILQEATEGSWTCSYPQIILLAGLQETDLCVLALKPAVWGVLGSLCVVEWVDEVGGSQHHWAAM